MITVKFMAMHINRSHVFRLTFFLMNVFIALKGSHFWFNISTNITITSAVWLLGTLYININFDNLSCLLASVKQTKSYIQEIKVPCSFIPILVLLLYFKRKLPPVLKRKSIFQKSFQLSNLIWFSEKCLNLPTHFISYIKQPKVGSIKTLVVYPN